MRAAIISVLVFACSSAAGAQTCTADDSYESCWKRLTSPDEPEEQRAVAAKAAKDTEAAVAAAATGITSFASASESSLKDFLSLLAGSLENATTSDEGSAFTIDWNPTLALGRPGALKLQGVFRDPTLHADISTALGDDATAFADDLGFGDDAVLSTALQPYTASLGRSIAPHRAWFEAMLIQVQANDPRADDAMELQRIALGLRGQESSTPFKELKTPDGTRALSSAEIAVRIALVETEARAFLRESAAITKFSRAFAQLLNNQPQLYASASYHARRNFVGPNEWAFKLTYELAGNNLNTFRKKQRDTFRKRQRDTVRNTEPDCTTARDPETLLTCAALP